MTTTEPDLVGTAALVAASGLTFRQIDYWTRLGLLHTTAWDGECNPTDGSGRYRHYPIGEVHIAQTAARLLAAGFTVEAALDIARKFATGTTVDLRAGFWLADLTVESVGEA